MVEEGGVVAGGQREVELGGGVAFIGFLAGLEVAQLQKSRAMPEQFKGAAPLIEIGADARLDERLALLPSVLVRRAVERRLGDGTTKTLTDSSATGLQRFYRVRVEANVPIVPSP